MKTTVLTLFLLLAACRGDPVYDFGEVRTGPGSTAAPPPLDVGRFVSRLYADVLGRRPGALPLAIDCDAFDPAIMPAVGTPEPGGLTWYEMLALLRRVIDVRQVVGCDIVELCPMPGNVAPNFLCAKLIYKILSYRFASEIGNKADR